MLLLMIFTTFVIELNWKKKANNSNSMKPQGSEWIHVQSLAFPSL